MEVVSDVKIGKVLSTFIEYMFVFVTILQCNTVYFRSGLNNRIQIMWFGICFLLVCISLFEMIIKSYNIKQLVLSLTIFLAFMVTILFLDYQIYPFPIKKEISQFIIIPFMMVIIFYNKILAGEGLDLLVKVERVMLILAGISLFFWGVSELGVPTNMATFITWGNYQQISGYNNVHFIAQGITKFLGMTLIRNTGIFVEAPMYSYALTVSFLVLLFIDGGTKKSRILKAVVLLATIFTTTSTTGVIVSILAIAYYEFFIVDRISLVFKVLIILLGLIAVGVLIKIILLQKLSSNWNSSSSIRMNDLLSGLSAWKNNIVFGNGLENYQILLDYMDPRRLGFNGNMGFSSGLMQVLAYGGIAMGLFYIIPSIMGMLVSKKMFGFSSICFLLFIFTIVNDTYLYFIILSAFFASFLLRKKYKEGE
ncbi:hypothetical protein FD30_GL001322 [Levilactobacillus namurensis DSM 19117]|uniref:Uncharacterized protein n=1 Tax=Levilactobacillus namurensis DSM 19117 TaxID=1423773 RepID=A0A0R1JMI5_9LACO|nr:hypothetical protein [Levilactobacillus namurensis]KRK72678.1 hypothetical protein FD30_GL001322 [Levilactobacillus namurensis DSM 19117]GEO75048.1 hypothetical protein LNA02_17460 [Levilactobacillus namurensis]